MEASTGIEPVYTDLQSAASPLRHEASGAGFYVSSKREARPHGRRLAINMQGLAAQGRELTFALRRSHRMSTMVAIMLSECPNCRCKISPQNTVCPGCHAPLRQAPRDAARPVFLWAFIAFNILMIGWLAFYILAGKTGLLAPRILSATLGGGDAAGTPVGGGFGVGYLVTLWIWGTIVLGLFAIPSFKGMKKSDAERGEK